MSDSYQYFTIPIASVPDSPPYTVWFATWSADQYVWSRTRPAPGGTTTTWVCGATESRAPCGATIIVDSTIKCIDPPPLTVPIDVSETDFRAALQQQLTETLDARSL